MNSIALEILIILALILINGLLAMAEIAVVSARKARLQQLSNQGNAKGNRGIKRYEVSFGFRNNFAPSGA